MLGRPHDRSSTNVKYDPPSFDDQASKYDSRVGLTGMDSAEIARSVLDIAEFKSKDLVLEIGAGTGEIGQWFPQFPVRYIGLDLSAGMLAEFRHRLDSNDKLSVESLSGELSSQLTQDKFDVTLIHADGNQKWPVEDGTVRVIFSSRTIHLLEPDLVLAEVFRVARKDGTFLIVGRIQRSKDSMKAKMKQGLQRLLRARGFSGREGEQNQQKLIELFCEKGAFPIAPVTVSRWKESSTPADSLDNWRQKSGLAGNDFPANIKQEILAELQTWAEETFGGLNTMIESESAYVLQGVRLG